MNLTIPLIMMGCCALTTACSTISSGRGDPLSDLDHFYLSTLRVEDTDLETALKAVEENYRTICRQCGDPPRRWKVTVSGEPHAKVGGDLGGQTASDAIRLLAAQAGMEVGGTSHRLTLTPYPADSTVVEREYAVPPTFASDLGSGFKAGQASPARDISDGVLLRDFRRLGFLQSPGARVHYDPKRSYLTIKDTALEQQRIAALLEVYLGRSPLMIKLSTRRVTFGEDPGLPTGTLTERGAERWWRRASRLSTAVPQTLPSVTARLGEEATLEITRELQRGSHRSWIGTKLRLQGGLLGRANLSKLHYERRVAVVEGQELASDAGSGDESSFGPAPGLDKLLAAARPNPGDPVPLRTRISDTSAPLPDGSTLIVKTIGSSEKVDYVLYSTFRIDATGRPLEDRE